MAVIETKYSIGDVIFCASTHVVQKQHPCPDCKGERRWKAVSPAGSEYSFECPRCSARFLNDRDLSLTYSCAVPVATRMTIGSIKHDTHDSNWKSDAWVKGPKTQYMCVETGVGSGSMHDEDRLFADEADALECAKLMANETNSKVEWIVKTYNKTLSISDYQLENAMMQEAKDAKSNASRMLWNVGYLFEKIEEAEGKDEIIEAVEWYKTYDWQEDKDAIAKAYKAVLAEDPAQ